MTTKTPNKIWEKTAPNFKAIPQAVSAIMGRDGKNGFQQLKDDEADIAHLTPVRSTVSASFEYKGDSKNNLDAIEMRNPHSTKMDEISIYGPKKNAKQVEEEKKKNTRRDTCPPSSRRVHTARGSIRPRVSAPKN